MRKQYYLWIITLFMILGVSPGTHGATYNVEKSRDHGAWVSLKLSLGSLRFYRAINVKNYSDTRVMVDFDSKKCAGQLKVHLEFPQSFAETEDLVLRDIAIRVDRKPIHDSLIEASTESGDNTLYGSVLVGDFPRLISEMRFGRVLRFKWSLLGDSEEPLYGEFSLNGSKAALDRARALCKQDQVGPEEYFEEGGSSKEESAADYF